MMLLSDCREVAERIPPLVEKSLAPEEAEAVQAHLRGCPRCFEAVRRFQRLQAFAQGALGPNVIPAGFTAETGRRLQAVTSHSLPVLGAAEATAAASLGERVRDRLGAAPWWAVSVVLHVLVIVLLGLITMSIGSLEDLNSVVVLTNLEKMAAANPVEEARKFKADLRDILEAKHETPAADPNSAVQSNIVVPPHILAQAELGDHFETLNLDRPDTQSAFGNPDAHMFHSASGNDEPEGGGGLGGMSLMDDLIGIGGSSSPGTGGGWGGGNGTGTGVGNGAGHGSFGQRNGGGRKLLVMRHGGSKATESAVDKGLDWLARHQEADGHWDIRKYQGGLADASEIGTNGLALLAFLGAGHTERVGRYKDNVQRSVKWFIENQAKSGQFLCRSDMGSSRLYGHGIATMAISEAAAMSRNPEVRAAAQKGIQFIDASQNRTGADGYEREGWDYTPKGGTNDTSVTSWMVLALKSAKVAGLSIEPGCFEGGLRWLDAAQGKDEYKLGIWYRGTIAEVKEKQAAKPQMNYNNSGYARENALLAAAGVMRMFLGGATKSDPRIMTTGEHLAKRLPEWKPNGQTCFYHLYYGTLCMFQIGGPEWKAWNEALKKTLLPNQAVGGDDDGSWDPTVDWLEKYGGRVYTTAMGCLCLEVYYRYLPLYSK